jgi:hypothetical protein
VSSSGTPPRASQSNQDSIVNEPQLLTITSNEKKSGIGYGRFCGVSSAFFVSFTMIFAVQEKKGREEYSASSSVAKKTNSDEAKGYP